jgi:GNAT superfamily N-acetyltransferase
MNIEDRRRKDRRRRFVRVNEERRHGEGRREADEYRRRIRIIRECLLVRALGRKRWGTPDRATVWLAIALGWYEGRPLDVSAVAALTGCSRQTVTRHIATLKEQGAADTRRNGRRTIVIPLRRGHGATRAFFNAVEAAMRRGGNPRHRSETDT